MRLLRRLFFVALWLLTLPLLAITVLRFAGFEGRVSVVAAEAAIGLLLLPAYAVLVISILGRRRALAVVAGVVVVAHAAWTAPSVIPHRASRSGQALRVMSFNVRYANTNLDAIVRELNHQRADVVVTVELTRRLFDRLRADPSFSKRFPESVAEPAGSNGIGIWSRYLVSDYDVVKVAGRDSARVTIDVHGHSVRVWGVHTIAPVGGSRTMWLRALRILRRQVRDARRNGPPLVVAGDFNATGGNPSFGRLIRSGHLHEAHAEAGRGWATTWPAGRRVPTLVRLDHILVGRRLGVRRAWEGDASGSDHRPIVADLVIRTS